MYSDKDMADATNVVQSIDHIFSRGHATLELAVSVRRYVGRSEILLNCGRFLHYSSCPTVHDWIALYPDFFLPAVHLSISPHVFLTVMLVDMSVCLDV